MSVKTKDALKSDFSDNVVATGAKFADLIDTMKVLQTAVTDPSASGYSTQFISSISQDENGAIVATKKNVSFSGYQTVAGMSAYQTVAGMSAYQTVAGMSAYQTVAGMSIYQANDLQQVGGVTAAAGDSQTINHNMKHYPTVRLIDATGVEVKVTEYTVKHADNMSLDIILGGSLTGAYKYILD